jgi:ubiquinone/menaquinone biosynthesis C-methylase UbiE
MRIIGGITIPWEHKKKIQERYRKEYSHYDKTRSSWVKGYVGLIEREVIFSFLKGTRILEVGAGTGRYACSLKSKNYVGIDLSYNMLKVAKEKSPEAFFICGDGENLPFREETFDTIICSRTFRFIPNPSKALTEAHRVLKEGGRCIITVDFLRDFYGYKIAQFIFKKFPCEIHYWIHEITELYKNARFKIVYQETPFNFPETFYQKVPLPLWKFVKWVDDRLKKWIKGWFLIVVGKSI